MRVGRDIAALWRIDVYQLLNGRSCFRRGTAAPASLYLEAIEVRWIVRSRDHYAARCLEFFHCPRDERCGSVFVEKGNAQTVSLHHLGNALRKEFGKESSVVTDNHQVVYRRERLINDLRE